MNGSFDFKQALSICGSNLLIVVHAVNFPKNFDCAHKIKRFSDFADLTGLKGMF